MKITIETVCLLSIAAVAFAAADAHVDIYTAKDIQGMGQALAKDGKSFASRDLVRYGNHYTMLAMREATGSSELHEHEADIFVIENGKATIVTGGKLINPQTQKPGEIRGTSISGGERHALEAGDIIHIPAGVPHQLLVENAPFEYFVIKVTGQ
jgi:mannose-6-phosphate isomerase-like protein (cupin superfamily)